MTPESEFPFFRLTETTLSMPWLAPDGKTLLTVDIGREKGDEFRQMDDEVPGELCLENLKTIILDARALSRVPGAQNADRLPGFPA
jgi:protoporphyrinogen/coproporphyrinogen III oxidase